MSMSGSQGTRKAAQQEILIGRTLQNGAYVIEAVLGHGGMGQVFLASHAQVDVPVAIKQVRADEPLPPGVIEELDYLLHNKGTLVQPLRGDFPVTGGTNTDRFLREALLLARLRHPAIPLLYDYFLENGQWYLVMEYVPGSTLSFYIREHAPLPPLEAVNYALQICDVLDYLHKQNPPVVFRDLKPANIILHPDGRLMIVDFGIARYFKEGQFNDTTDFGSPGYASPEQYEGIGQTDARSDLFSLGVILHEMLSGQRPTRRDISMEQLESLHKLNPGISPALSGLVMVATRTEPMYRFQSAHTFYQALERVRSVEERRSYRYHTLMAEVNASQRTPAFPMLIPPPSSQGFLSSELAREQDQRAQHMRMREQPQRSTVRASLEQEALAHQLTSIDESLKLRAVSATMSRSAPHSAVMPTFNLNEKETTREKSVNPAAPPSLPPVPPSPSTQPAPRKKGKGKIILSLFLLLFLLLSSILFYYYISTRAHTSPSSHGEVAPEESGREQVTIPVEPVNVWQSLPSLPSEEADNVALYVQISGQGFVYITGGYRGPDANPTYSQGIFRYNISTAHWENVNLPALPLMGNNAAALDEQGNIFLSGGYSPDLGTISPHLYQYAPASGAFHVVDVPPTMPLGFGSSMLADQQGHLYLTEGFLTPGYPSAQAGLGWYRYDIAGGVWHTLANLPVGVGYVHLIQDSNGNILLLGGARDAGQHQPSLLIYRYDVQQNVWNTTSATLPGPLSGSASCLDGNGHLVIVGGFDPLHDTSLNSLRLFNISTLRWQSLVSLPNGGSVLGTAACDGNGHVYVTRGASTPTKPTRDFLELTLPQSQKAATAEKKATPTRETAPASGREAPPTPTPDEIPGGS